MTPAAPGPQPEAPPAGEDLALSAGRAGDAPPEPLLVGNAGRQLLAAYVATGSKIVAWVIAAAVVYRLMGPGPFALFMLLRGTLVVINYTAFGLGPAVLHYAALATARQATPLPVESTGDGPDNAAQPAVHDLSYAGPRTTRNDQPTVVALPGETPANVLLHAAWLTAALGLAGLLVLWLYDAYFTSLHVVPRGAAPGDLKAIYALGLGVLLRAIGDVAGGFNHSRGWFIADQAAVAAADLVWALLCLKIALEGPVVFLDEIGSAYAFTGVLAAAARWIMANFLAADASSMGSMLAPRVRHQLGVGFYAKLLSLGGLVTLGSVAEFLYAPIDYVILNRFIDPIAVAVYAPAVQVDAAIILLVTAIGTVLLPRVAILHAGQDQHGVWREYLRGTLAAAGLALGAAMLAWTVSPWLFQVWLGNDLPATRAILPLVLIHTVIGASAGAGRATLIAVGRAGAYATSVLIGGLVNVGLSLGLVWAGWGLRGVVLGTVMSVALRCLLWMPWFVRRSVRPPKSPDRQER